MRLNADNRTFLFKPQFGETGTAPRKQDHLNVTQCSDVSRSIWAVKEKGTYRT